MGVIRMNTRIVTNQPMELVETPLNSFAGRVVISDSVQGDFEALVTKFKYEPQIVWVLQASAAMPSIGNARERPYRSRGTHPEFHKQSIDRAYIFDCAQVSVVMNSKREYLVVREPSHRISISVARERTKG